MPVMPKKPGRTRSKCYLHEMQRPLELPYERHKYHICWVCQSRLLEMAKAGVNFELQNQVVTISITSAVEKEAA